MSAKLDRLKARELPDFLVDKAAEFLDSGDVSIPRNISSIPPDWQYPFIGKDLVDNSSWDEESRQLLRFFIHLSDGAAPSNDEFHEFLFGALRHLHGDDYAGDPNHALRVVEEIETHHSALSSFVAWYLGGHTSFNNWTFSEDFDAEKPFISPVANLFFKHLGDDAVATPEILTRHGGLLAAFAKHRPELARAWCAHSSVGNESWNVVGAWCAILDASSDFDELCLSACENMRSLDADVAFRIMRYFVEKRGEGYLDRLLDIAADPQAALGHEALEMLLKHRSDEVVKILARAFTISDAGDHTSCHDGPAYAKLFEMMLAEWDSGGSELLSNMTENYNNCQLANLVKEYLPRLSLEQLPALREGFLRRVERTDSRGRAELWETVGRVYPAAFASDFEELLAGKSKPLRAIAAGGLSETLGHEFIPRAAEILVGGNLNSRHGAALFFEALADPETSSTLLAALEIERADAVRDALHAALSACGADSESSHDNMNKQNFDAKTIISSIPKKVRLPKSPWLDLKSLPALHFVDGSTLPEEAIVFLIAKQAKQKAIEAAPDILPLLTHIDREKSAAFAEALVEGFLNSAQAASDRWALTLGGLLGDKRIITLLLPRVQGWCENSRHKLAEYAAQAISLLPGDEPLMVLDTLANRYRSKFKNIGRACSEAFTAAATARGISPDELGDMVVPSFGFDAEGVRRFDWEGGGISAELGANFKLTWFDPETEKSWKSLPAGAPDETKAEVKTVNKLIRETVKAQTARLEMSLVRQRRWPVARWRELFESHPLLSSFASGLVWGVYDVSGDLLRTFRRYPNGILADANGEMEELEEADTVIGMVHPLELTGEAIEGWHAHLSRMKVKQPFPQIDRPVELLDPLHGNRREISLTGNRELSAGTFRSRAEKRGWTRGSVIDAGGIASYYKLYPGAGVEVNLPTENFWVGCDPMETVTLGPACFAKAGTIERGSYIYNEPEPDDPRVLRFDQVPSVVYSETLADLKAIIATKE